MQTSTVFGPAVVNTREVIQTSIQQVGGRNQVVTREIVRTQGQQSIVYQTVKVAQVATVTRTITASCGNTGYNYHQPANAHTYG